MEIGDYFGREAKTPRPGRSRDGQTDKAGRWGKVVASERQSWVRLGRVAQALG